MSAWVLCAYVRLYVCVFVCVCVTESVQCLFCPVVADWAVSVDFVCCCFDRCVFPAGTEWGIVKDREMERERVCYLAEWRGVEATSMPSVPSRLSACCLQLTHHLVHTCMMIGKRTPCIFHHSILSLHITISHWSPSFQTSQISSELIFCLFRSHSSPFRFKTEFWIAMVYELNSSEEEVCITYSNPEINQEDRCGIKALSLMKTNNRNPDAENLIQYLPKMYNGIQKFEITNRNYSIPHCF